MRYARYTVAVAMLLLMAGWPAPAQQPKPDQPKRPPPKREEPPQDEPKRDEPVALSVWAIRATTKNKDVSPELKELAEKLKRQFKYTGYKLEKKAADSAELKKTAELALIQDYAVKVTPRARDGKKVQLDVEVFRGKDRKAKVNFTINSGEFYPLAGYPLDGGDELMIAISGR